MKFSVLFLFLGLYALPAAFASDVSPQDGEARIIDEQVCSVTKCISSCSEKEEKEPISTSKGPLFTEVNNCANEITPKLINMLSELDLNHNFVAGIITNAPLSLLETLFTRREILLLDLTETVDLKDSMAYMEALSELAINNAEVRKSPSAMASLLLQLEWRLTLLAVSMEFFKNAKDYEKLFCAGISFKSIILESNSESMPIIVQVFKNPLSYSASKALKKAYAADPLFKESLKQIGQPGIFLDPVDLHDAIDFFARCSFAASAKHAELSHKLASFIMASNLSEYHEQSSTSSASAVNYQVALEDFIVSCRDDRNPASNYHSFLTLFRKGHFEAFKHVHLYSGNPSLILSMYLSEVNFETNIAIYAELLKALPFLEDQMKLVKKIIDAYKFSEYDVKHLLSANLHFLSGPGRATIKMIEEDHHYKCTVASGGKRTTVLVSDLAKLFTQCFIKKHLMFKKLLLDPNILRYNGKVDKEFKTLRNELITSIDSTPLGAFLFKVLPFLHDSNEVLYKSVHQNYPYNIQQLANISKYRKVDGVAVQTAMDELGRLTKDSKHLRLDNPTFY